MISAKIIAHSVSTQGKEIVSYELEFNRFVLSEFLTHRAISKNSSSSRAIPIKKQLGLIWNDMAMPVFWGANQSGMSANEELTGWKLTAAKAIWRLSGKVVCGFSFLLYKLGLHKQIGNRITEPWSHIKIIATATDWDNFFHLRLHPAAQPEIRELARVMREAYAKSTPQLLFAGEWHLPYVDKETESSIGVDNAIKLSASLCAQTSYRNSNDSLEKALLIYERLVSSDVVHSSPFEHQATPAVSTNTKSGNFTGWLQHRQNIPNNVCDKYKR